MQRTPGTVKSVIVADKQSKSFRIALSVLKNTFDKDVITKALIDSGASMEMGLHPTTPGPLRSYTKITMAVSILTPFS